MVPGQQSKTKWNSQLHRKLQKKSKWHDRKIYNVFDIVYCSQYCLKSPHCDFLQRGDFWQHCEQYIMSDTCQIYCHAILNFFMNLSRALKTQNSITMKVMPRNRTNTFTPNQRSIEFHNRTIVYEILKTHAKLHTRWSTADLRSILGRTNSWHMTQVLPTVRCVWKCV